MEAPEFIKEKTRMCRMLAVGIPVCQECPVLPKANAYGTSCTTYIKEHPYEAVRIIERWVKEHPRKTRQIKFLETLPRAVKDLDGVITLCPHDIDSAFSCPKRSGSGNKSPCPECRKKYWFEEVD